MIGVYEYIHNGRATSSLKQMGGQTIYILPRSSAIPVRVTLSNYIIKPFLNKIKSFLSQKKILSHFIWIFIYFYVCLVKDSSLFFRKDPF